ncbi:MULTISPECIES: sodium:calcium antiporter [Halolamina]|uniref:Cation:H+ antiporter n=1 Tax=Halolamina pelagica TaxID=699431 RepID=A0A1I5MLX8_9EURY|nr:MULTISPECIES: sodium:calcium antiporter [Halolamina]NHX36073.1 sodium:calcium antiporter [Halolamina sp. R1-12]SFP10297.1 cation:H+ antiporter [Halolamina pelagica]
MNTRKLGALCVAAVLTLPWLGGWLTGMADGLTAGPTVAVAGIGILGASFLLTWGAETAEKDVPRAFAIAVLAVLAVAPEYAVDALYAWQAGVQAGTPAGIEAGNLAVANMTGANRILIGIGWAGIALFTVYRAGASRDTAVKDRRGFLKNAVSLDRDISLEISFLLAATVWAFLVPLGAGIDVFDMAVLVGLYVLYIGVVLRGEPEEDVEHVGVPAMLGRIPNPFRALTVIALFLFSGLIIFTAVEPFAHSLELLGEDIGVPSFFMIQWIAPLASESPELIVVVVLVRKARSTAGFNALISSKLNQWTLLIGTLVIVHSIALGEYGALAFDAKQAAEIWITAAQSLFAIALVINFEIDVREALVLLVLFLSQVVLEFLALREVVHLPVTEIELLHLFTATYVVLALGLFATRRGELVQLVRDTRRIIRSAVHGNPEEHPFTDD